MFGIAQLNFYVLMSGITQQQENHVIKASKCTITTYIHVHCNVWKHTMTYNITLMSGIVHQYSF